MHELHLSMSTRGKASVPVGTNTNEIHAR